MRKSSKAWLTVAFVLILTGALLFGGVMTAKGWDFTALGNPNYEAFTFDIDGDFESISVRSKSSDIAFVPSETGKCSVVFHEKSTANHTASVSEGTLNIETDNAEKWFEPLAFMFDDPQITVYLPKNEYVSLRVHEKTGDVSVPKNFSFDHVDISVSTGDVEYHASASGEVKIAVTTGSIRAEDISAGALEFSATTGAVNVHSVACEGSISASLTTGDTLFRDVTCKSLASTASTGDITLQNTVAAETIALETSTGDVRLDKCDAAELSIGTSTGDVTGSLLTDKFYHAKSHTGRVSVPVTTGGGKCEITTNTGNIDMLTVAN